MTTEMRLTNPVIPTKVGIYDATITETWQSKIKEGTRNMRQAILLIWIITLLPGLIFQIAFGQVEQYEQNNALEKFGIYPYPSEDDVKDSEFSSEGFIVEPLSTDDINKNFSNIEDLSWLEPIAKAHQVVLIGESHYFQYIKHLRNRILFALNIFDTYPILILERSYSHTPFINYYLSLEQEDDVRQFEQENADVFLDESDYQLFHHIRRWNRLHPEHTIQVGCSDIEHDYAFTFHHIVFPYVIGLNLSIKTDSEKFQGNLSKYILDLEWIFKTHRLTSFLEIEEAFRPLESFIAVAKERQFIGEYSFLTPEYIVNVIENLKSSYNAYTQDFFQHRQQAIIRNLTNECFLGNYFNVGKMLIHAGSYHTPTHYPNLKEDNFLREGSYLTYEFELTKGTTYSINIWGLAFSSILDMKDVDIAVESWGRTEYGDIIENIQQAVTQKLVSQDAAYYIHTDKLQYTDRHQDTEFAGREAFMRCISHIGYQHHNQPVLFQQIPWSNLLEQSKLLSLKHYTSLAELQKVWQQYDLNIMVPVSPLIKLRIWLQ